jgi:peroxiredoxin
LSGHAAVTKPGSDWQVTWQFTYLGPRSEPAQDGSSAKLSSGAQLLGRVDFVKTVPDSAEPRPAGASFPSLLLLQGFGRAIADDVVHVKGAGKETLKFSGEDVACDILKVSYAPPTYERPHPEAVTYWISPAKQLVLKEELTYSAGPDDERGIWTLVFDSLKRDRPIPPWVRDMTQAPELKERTEWIGKVAPGFTLPAADGSPVRLSSYQGKAVLLDFWSILCGPCKLEMPTIEELGREYQNKGVVVLGISSDPAANSQAWLDRNKHTLRTLTDSGFAVSGAYKVEGIPALVLIGRDGKVKRYWEGTVGKETVRAALDASLK